MPETAIGALLETQRTIWVLVETDRTATIAAPPEVPPEEVFGQTGLPDWANPLGSPLEPAMQCALNFLARHPEWAMVASALRETPDIVESVHHLLPVDRSRELTEAEYEALVELGMDLPFGDWARPQLAVVYLVQ